MKNFYLAISVLAISFIIAASTNAATFNVTTTNDTLDANPGDGVCADAGAACSLRAAIGEANALAGADIIKLPVGNYTQTLVAPNEDANLGGDWDITSTITINGVNPLNTYLQAAATEGTASERVLDVRAGGDLTISRLTARWGRFSGVMTADTRGAGIQNLGKLTFEDAVVRSNQITSTSGNPMGAGVYNAGTSFTINIGAVVGNVNTMQAGSAFGGGIASVGTSTLTFSRAVIDSNSAIGTGGYGFGAGMYLQDLFTTNMTDSVFSNNVGSGTNGSNGSGVRVLSNVGAAVFNCTGCVFRFNKGTTGTSHQGTGLQLFTTVAGATLTATIDRTRFFGNTGNSDGIGVNATVNGGNMNLNILNSAIIQNTGGARGGGIFITNAGSAAPASSTATVDITNTTISNNSSSGNGGGFMLEQPSSGAITANLSNVTIAANTGGTGGGISHSATGTLNMKNSVVGDNAGGAAPDVSGGIVSGDYNHIENTVGAVITGATANNGTGDALLGPYVEHVGGAVHMPAAASPLVNAIPNGTNGCGTSITSDQRGVSRVQGGGCEKGAVERAVSASIGGRVLNYYGHGIRNAWVVVSGDGLPQPLYTTTSAMGWYSFENLPAEQTYTIRASAKRFRFDPFHFAGTYLIRDTYNLDIVAEQQFEERPAEK